MKKNRPQTLKEKRRNLIIKWLLYLLVMAASFLFMTVTDSIMPLFHIPIAICIAIYEKSELTSAFVGLLCGLLTDVACGKLFGFNGFLLTVVCMFVSLLFLYVLRHNTVNYLIVNSATVVVFGLLDYLFFYAMWGSDVNGRIFLFNILIPMLLTIAISPVMWFLFKIIHKYFGVKKEHFMAEQSDDIVRE